MDAHIQRAIARAVLRSEVWRTGLVIATAASLLLLVAVLRYSAEATPLFQSRARLAFTVLATLLISEGVVLFWLVRWRKAGRSSPWWFRYLNTLAEVSLPSLGLLLSATLMGLAPSLAGAAPYLYFVLIVLSALYLDLWLCTAAGAMAALQFSLIAFYALRGQEPVPGWEVLTSAAAHWLKAAMLLVTGLAAGFVAAQIKRQLLAAVRSTSERDRAVSIFGQHVSPQVAEMLLKQPVEYTGEQRNVCVMFLDIRDFSKLAAAHTPNQVMEYLNTLFGSLISIVNQHRGIVNKFLGDGFMAVFGAPLGDSELCESAVAAAKAILAAVEKLNARGAIPPTRVGIGLHVGEALTGNVGSTERKEYTVIGDVVNLASRIEQATKQFQANLIVSEAVRERLDAARHRLEDLGLVELKGQPRPTRLFRVA